MHALFSLLALGLVHSSCRVEGWVMDLTSGLVWALGAISVALRLETSAAESPLEPKSFLNCPLRHHMRSAPVSDYWKRSIKIYFIIFCSVSLGSLLHLPNHFRLFTCLLLPSAYLSVLYVFCFNLCISFCRIGFRISHLLGEPSAPVFSFQFSVWLGLTVLLRVTLNSLCSPGRTWTCVSPVFASWQVPVAQAWDTGSTIHIYFK